jgi:hypothetical protein
MPTPNMNQATKHLTIKLRPSLCCCADAPIPKEEYVIVLDGNWLCATDDGRYLSILQAFYKAE